MNEWWQWNANQIIDAQKRADKNTATVEDLHVLERWREFDAINDEYQSLLRRGERADPSEAREVLERWMAVSRKK